MAPKLRWSSEKWAVLEGLARKHRLKIVTGNNVHLKQVLLWREIASIHVIGEENDICVNPNYSRVAELLYDLGSQLLGATARKSTLGGISCG